MFTPSARALIETYLQLIGLISIRVQAHLAFGFQTAPRRLARVVGKAWRYAKAKALEAIRAEAHRQIADWEGLRALPRAAAHRAPTDRPRTERGLALRLLPPLREASVHTFDRMPRTRRENTGPTYGRLRAKIDRLVMLMDESPQKQAARLRRLGRALARRLVRHRLRRPVEPAPPPGRAAPRARLMRSNRGPRVRWTGSG